MKRRSIFFYYLLLGIILTMAFRKQKSYALNFSEAEVMAIDRAMYDQESMPVSQYKSAVKAWQREIKPHTDSTGRLK